MATPPLITSQPDDITRPPATRAIFAVVMAGTGTLVSASMLGGAGSILLATLGSVLTAAGLQLLRMRDRWQRDRLYVDEQTGMLTLRAFHSFCGIELLRCDRMAASSLMVAIRFATATSLRDARAIARTLSTGLRSYDLCHFDLDTATALVLVTNVSDVDRDAQPLLQRITNRLRPYGLQSIGFDTSASFGTNVELGIERACDAAGRADGGAINSAGEVDVAHLMADSHGELIESCMLVLQMQPEATRRHRERWAAEISRRASAELPAELHLIAELATLVRVEDAPEDPQVRRRLSVAVDMLERRSGIAIATAIAPIELRRAEQILLDAWAAAASSMRGDAAA